jgi:hypothetical protein
LGGAHRNLGAPSSRRFHRLVEETTTHPELGTLAPPAEVGKAAQRKSAVTLLIEKLFEGDEQNQEEPITIPTSKPPNRPPKTMPATLTLAIPAPPL